MTKSFGFLTSTPAEGDVPAIDEEESYIIFSAEKNEKHGVYDGYDGDNTSVVSSDFAINGHNAVRAKNMRYVGFQNNTFNPAKTDMTSLVLDIFVTEPHAKENCHVKAENQGTLNFPQDLNRGWNHVVLTNFNTSTFAGLTSNTTLFVRIDDAETENVVIYNLYYSTASAAKSITFNNDASWTEANVRVYAWYNDGADHAVTNTWPGDAVGNCATGNTLTNNGDGTYTWTTTGDPEYIIFSNNASNQTADLTFVDGETYNSKGIVGKYGYYIVGTMNSWTLSDEFKMTKNDAQTSYNEYMFEKLSLESSNEFKINYSADGVIKSDSYYPTNSISGYNGPYNVYFCPEGGRDGWLNGYVYMQQTYNVIVNGNKATVTGAINAGNLDAVKSAVGMSKYIDVSDATLGTYFSTDNPNALYLYKTNEDATSATNTPNPVRYDGARFYVAPQGLTLVDAPATYEFPENAFSSLSSTHMVTINRSIAGNSYVTSFMSRAASPGYPMVATLEDGLEAYELTAAEAGQLTFTKVTGDLETNKGYVIHNTTSDPLTLTWDSHQNDQIYLDYTSNQNPDDVTAVDGVKILGTMHTVETTASDNPVRWILSGGYIKQAKGAKISAYRAYFTGVTPPNPSNPSQNARAIFLDGETTKIGSINANGEISVEDGIIYNLAGQRVQNPTKGIYIINGKKVVIK